MNNNQNNNKDLNVEVSPFANNDNPNSPYYAYPADPNDPRWQSPEATEDSWRFEARDGILYMHRNQEPKLICQVLLPDSREVYERALANIPEGCKITNDEDLMIMYSAGNEGGLNFTQRNYKQLLLLCHNCERQGADWWLKWGRYKVEDFKRAHGL